MTSVFSFIFCAWSGAVIAENTRLICILEGNGSWYLVGTSSIQDIKGIILQKEYDFSSDQNRILDTNEMWLSSNGTWFEKIAMKNHLFEVTQSVTDREIIYDRSGYIGAPLTTKSNVDVYHWHEKINRFSGYIKIKSRLLFTEKNGGSYEFEMQASGKCEDTQKKF